MIFRENDQVWLESKHLALPHQSKKLAPKRMGPFCIIRIISPVAFQLELPLSWGIHNVFHASLLTKYQETTAHGPNFSHPPPDLIEGEEEFEVEAVINHRLHGRRHQLQYLVKWVGYPHSDNMWEPTVNVHAPDLIRDYQRQKSKTLKSRVLITQKPSPPWSNSTNQAQLSSTSLIPGIAPISRLLPLLHPPHHVGHQH